MNKFKFLTIAVVGLFIMNILLFGYVLLQNRSQNHPIRANHKEPKNVIIHRLNFDDEQVNTYENLIKQHQERLRFIHDEINETKHLLYKQLNSTAVPDQNELMDHLGNLYVKLELADYKHFEAIKNICREDQMDEYEKLTKDLSHLFLKRPPR